MTTSPEDPVLDVERILATLDRHHVDYLVVGGISTRLHGALRPTKDFDCLSERSRDNLARLGAVMRELNARLRVAALTDAEAQQLPRRIDATSLQQMQLSTWRTDAGDFDVLADMPDRHISSVHRGSSFDAPRNTRVGATAYFPPRLVRILALRR